MDLWLLYKEIDACLKMIIMINLQINSLIIRSMLLDSAVVMLKFHGILFPHWLQHRNQFGSHHEKAKRSQWCRMCDVAVVSGPHQSKRLTPWQLESLPGDSLDGAHKRLWYPGNGPTGLTNPSCNVCVIHLTYLYYIQMNRQKVENKNTSVRKQQLLIVGFSPRPEFSSRSEFSHHEIIYLLEEHLLL